MDFKATALKSLRKLSEGKELGRHAWITLVEDKGALCLSCADMDHLIFLPSEDAVLTRRAGKYSKLTAVVLKWSRARKRYERQGLLVEEAALQRLSKSAWMMPRCAPVVASESYSQPVRPGGSRRLLNMPA